MLGDPAASPPWLRWLVAISPKTCSVLLFLGGAAMLLSAATPQIAARIEWLAAIAPLGAIEASHFLGSILATVMLFLAYGVGRRLAVARRAAIAVCLAAAPLLLLGGILWEEAAFLLGIALLLWITGPAYYRQTNLSAVRPAKEWLAAAVIVLGVAAWAGFSAYETIPYSDDLWWTFLVDGDASRFLRALVGVGAMATLVLVWWLAAPVRPSPGDAEQIARAQAIITQCPHSAPEAWLATTGDKSFLFDETGRAFIMYAAHGDAWIAMGGPVGPHDARDEMIWRFRQAADVANAWAAFYSVGPDLLPGLLDAGFALQKIGETAIVDLPGFSLEGPSRSRLRQARARAARDGYVASIERIDSDGDLLSGLKAVSDAWLAVHQGAEKRFSLGRFDPAYLAPFPIGVLRREGRIVAFATLWTGGPGGDVAVDLMRASRDASGAMEVLLVELMLWAKAQGHRRFDLGMAPLAGLADRRLAPWLSRLGAFIYRHGRLIYGFEGLRTFKAKFDPDWQPRYLAAPGGWRLSAALVRTALLTSGGVLGMIRR